MSVVIETTIGDITVDLFTKERPQACLNFLKLCKLKYYNYNLFHNIERNFIAQTGDPKGAGDGGESVWGVIEGIHKRFFEAESLPKIKHDSPGLLSLVSIGKHMVSSQFFFTLGQDLISLDNIHCVIGEVAEGHDTLRKLNEAIVDEKFRPYQDIRITHTVILEDPFDDPRGFRMPSISPSPSAERLKNGRIAADEDIDDTEGKTAAEIQEMLAEREAKARATILEIVGDLPDAEIAPPENVLFVCKLNPVTTEDDLEIIFSRFGKVIGCEVIKDKISGDSLQYAFVEFRDKKACEAAYFKMDNVLIDDRRIHVDFSQSVAKVQWRGKGRGLIYKEGKEDRKLDFNNYKSSNRGDRRTNRNDNKNNYRKKSENSTERTNQKTKRRSRSYSPQQKFSSKSREYQRRNNDNRRYGNRRIERRNSDRSRSRSSNRDFPNSRYRQNPHTSYGSRGDSFKYDRRHQVMHRSRSRSPNKISSERYRKDHSRTSERRNHERNRSREKNQRSRTRSPKKMSRNRKDRDEEDLKKEKNSKKGSDDKVSSKTKKSKNKGTKSESKKIKSSKKRKRSSNSKSGDSSKSTASSSSDSNKKKRVNKMKHRHSSSTNDSSSD